MLSTTRLISAEYDDSISTRLLVAISVTPSFAIENQLIAIRFRLAAISKELSVLMHAQLLTENWVRHRLSVDFVSAHQHNRKMKSVYALALGLFK